MMTSMRSLCVLFMCKLWHVIMQGWMGLGSLAPGFFWQMCLVICLGLRCIACV